MQEHNNFVHLTVVPKCKHLCNPQKLNVALLLSISSENMLERMDPRLPRCSWKICRRAYCVVCEAIIKLCVAGTRFIIAHSVIHSNNISCVAF